MADEGGQRPLFECSPPPVANSSFIHSLSANSQQPSSTCSCEAPSLLPHKKLSASSVAPAPVISIPSKEEQNEQSLPSTAALGVLPSPSQSSSCCPSIAGTRTSSKEYTSSVQFHLGQGFSHTRRGSEAIENHWDALNGLSLMAPNSTQSNEITEQTEDGSSLRHVVEGEGSRLTRIDSQSLISPSTLPQAADPQVRQHKRCKDYLKEAEQYVKQQPYARRPDGTYGKITCLKCEKNVCHSVLFPCGHMCLCDACIPSDIRKGTTEEPVVQEEKKEDPNKLKECPVCKLAVHRALASDGKEVDRYWDILTGEPFRVQANIREGFKRVPLWLKTKKEGEKQEERARQNSLENIMKEAASHAASAVPVESLLPEPGARQRSTSSSKGKELGRQNSQNRGKVLPFSPSHPSPTRPVRSSCSCIIS